MIIRTKQEGPAIIFELEGHLDYETTEQLRLSAIEIAETTPSMSLILNMKNLKFVGSSGISQFVDVLKGLNKNKKGRPKLCNVSVEFDKMFKAMQTSRNPFEIYKDEQDAKNSIFQMSTLRPNREPLDN